MEDGQLDAALALFGEGVRVNPRDADAHTGMGNVLLEMGQAEHALAAFRQAVRVAPEHARARYHLGETLLERGREAEGLKELRKVLFLDDGDIAAAARERLRGS